MIGIASPSFCDLPFTRVLEDVSRHFRLWEVLSEGEHRLELIGEAVRYGRDSLGMSFQVHAPMSDVNIGSVHEPMRKAAMDEIRHTIAMCHSLEISIVTVHPGFVSGIAFLDRRKALERTRQSVMEIAGFAKAQGVKVAVENLPANINATCTTAADLLYAVDGTDLGLCFDLGHANTAHQVDEFLTLVDRFENVHLHNNGGQWDQHNVVDDGTADIEKVIRSLKGRYMGNHVVEATDLESGVASKAVLERLL